ncbi:oxysterol-binding protein-related protein 9-like isoform X1 [Argonauta hians]
MAIMEGPLCKWTNVMKGWQYRWFVLDEHSGLLSYYTSKDKMMRGDRRRCFRLKGAIIGIDDEEYSTFTITANQKTFHFQARDADEREKWIKSLENTILRHTHFIKHDIRVVPSMADFERKLSESDVYLQILIEQLESLEDRIDLCEDLTVKEKYNVITVTVKAMIESIKHTIMMLQITKESLKGPVVNRTLYDLAPPTPRIKIHPAEAANSLQEDTTLHRVETATDAQLLENDVCISQSMPNINIGSSPNPNSSNIPTDSHAPVNMKRTDASSNQVSATQVPDISYTSSEDEDFYDAEEYRYGSPKTTSEKSATSGEASPMQTPAEESPVDAALPRVITSEDDIFDELYDEEDREELESLENHGSVITHLLSQVRIGMDLTKVVLPTFILERRSLLEMYADFFAHPDLFVKIADIDNPKDRMLQVVRWYMSAFHAGRKSEIAKKPYNPILGEIFRCHWKIPGSNCSTAENPLFPWATEDNLIFIAEQVSHHPPISAFYAEHFDKRISLDGYIWTKSKFLGLSIGVHMIGQAVLSLPDFEEEYIFTFPNGYGRSILTVPWVELGGKVSLTCPKSGYSANIEFHTKPFYGGKKHRITAEILAANEKKPFCNIEGEWNGVMYAKHSSGMNEVFVDTKRTPIVKKKVQELDKQDAMESRSLWKDVTYNLKIKNISSATEAKHVLEQRQRDEAKERKEKSLVWETKYFHEVGEHWVYDNPLLKRIPLKSAGNTNSALTQQQST